MAPAKLGMTAASFISGGWQGVSGTPSPSVSSMRVLPSGTVMYPTVTSRSLT
jgi:hypothetical protein